MIFNNTLYVIATEYLLVASHYSPTFTHRTNRRWVSKTKVNYQVVILNSQLSASDFFLLTLLQ